MQDNFSQVSSAPARISGKIRVVLAALAIVANLAGPEARAQGSPGPVITFVANAENLTKPRVRYLGRSWTADAGGFLAGSGRGQRLLADAGAAEGDFRVELELSLPRAGRESSLLVGDDGEVVMVSGGNRWELKGRVFRAADTPIHLAAPEIKPGKSFGVTLERRGSGVAIKVDGTEIYRGAAGAGAVKQFGIDPGTGLVQLYTLFGSGFSTDAPWPSQPFGNPFGMQLRAPPKTMGEVYAPVIVREAPTNEASIVARRDGTLEIYSITKPESDSVSVRRSSDGGLTWSDPRIAFRLPGRAYYALMVLEAEDGALHAVVHILGEGPGGYRGRLYEVYHTRQYGSTGWSEPRRVAPGYVGSINGFIQLSGLGRLVLAVARAIPEREQPPQSGPDRGWNDTFVYVSDDQGETWRQSPDELSLTLAAPNVTRYGAIEPALLELRGGRVWMLVRDRGGRLFESTSADGEHWPPLVRAPFISSDSPADLLRLKNGKIVLLVNACQNWSDPRSYAMGGREVLQAAVSADDGVTWRGFREILHETNVVSGGDRGTSYASLAENAAGKVVVVSGQGEGKRAILLFDPGWLEETASRSDFNLGPVDWTQYGDDGLKVENEERTKVLSIPLKSSGLAGAQWNFPIAAAGEISLRLQVPEPVKALNFSLNDHFTRIDDREAAAHAVATISLQNYLPQRSAKWVNVGLAWTQATSGSPVTVTIDGQVAGRVSLRRDAQFGVNYLRVEFRADTDDGRLRLADAIMRAQP